MEKTKTAEKILYHRLVTKPDGIYDDQSYIEYMSYGTKDQYLEAMEEYASSQLTALTEENEKLRGDLELVNKCWNADLSGIEDLRSGLKDEELANEALTEENKQLKEALEQHQQVINNYAANFERDKDSIYNLVSRNEALTESNKKLKDGLSHAGENMKRCRKILQDRDEGSNWGILDTVKLESLLSEKGDK